MNIVFNKLISDRHFEILGLSEKINFDHLKYHSKNTNCGKIRFNNFDNGTFQ